MILSQFHRGRTSTIDELTQEAIADWHYWVKQGYQLEARSDHPVVFVSWQAAQCFCRWAGGRLPTEAEWEYAPCAGSDSEFPWGEALPSPALANYGANDMGTTTPVGTYPPNPLGLYDMAGNVWEWLLDEWASVYSGELQTDPIAGGELMDDAVLTVRPPGDSWRQFRRWSCQPAQALARQPYHVKCS